MKLNKDTLAQTKARSHGYCWPYRQWGLSKSRTAVTCPIAFTAVYISIGAHIGTDSSVNIIIDTNTQNNTSMKFLDNYSSSVYIEWVAIGY